MNLGSLDPCDFFLEKLVELCVFLKQLLKNREQTNRGFKKGNTYHTYLDKFTSCVHILSRTKHWFERQLFDMLLGGEFLLGLFNMKFEP